MKYFDLKPINKMNKRHREALCEHVDSEAADKISKISESIPDKPSLDRHITSAIMNGTIELQSMDVIRDFLQKKVIGLGYGRTIIQRDYRDGDYISFSPECIFVIPEAYKLEYEVWEKESKKANEEIEEIKKSLKLIKMKIMVGSNEALSPLMDEIDSVGGNLSILNSSSTKLLLSDGSETELHKLS